MITTTGDQSLSFREYLYTFNNNKNRRWSFLIFTPSGRLLLQSGDVLCPVAIKSKVPHKCRWLFIPALHKKLSSFSLSLCLRWTCESARDTLHSERRNVRNNRDANRRKRRRSYTRPVHPHLNGRQQCLLTTVPLHVQHMRFACQFMSLWVGAHRQVRKRHKWAIKLCKSV